MEIDDLRAMTDDELTEDLVESERGLMNLRFRVSTMQVSDVNEIRNMRKRIARIRTIIRQRQLAKVSA